MDASVAFRFGQEVTQLNPVRKEVHVKSGNILSYGHLINAGRLFLEAIFYAIRFEGFESECTDQFVSKSLDHFFNFYVR
jgi:hypothetical protein